MIRRLILLALLLALLLATVASAEVSQVGSLRVRFAAALAPRRLPRTGLAPVGVSVGAEIETTDHSVPPQLQRIEIEINRHGQLDLRGLPLCALDRIEPATTYAADAACGAARVGVGRFEANVGVPGQAPFPSSGELVAYNGRLDGRPVIFAHVYGPEPIPTSFTLVFHISHHRGGQFDTVLRATMPSVTGSAGYITGVELRLKRRFFYQGARHSYLSAACPAPAGVSTVLFPLARASLRFAGDTTINETLTRSCRAR